MNQMVSLALAQKIEHSIFRAYDIRGIVDQTLHTHDLYALGLAFATEALLQQQRQVVVGYDGRLSSPVFQHALCQGLLEGGCDVINIGCVPTPLLYYATHRLASSGIMITGSHNPANYNGLKMVFDRKSPSHELLQNLYHRIIDGDLNRASTLGVYREHSLECEYIDYISHQIQLPKRLRVVVDCGNGAGSELFPSLLTALGCEVIPLFCEIDGRFPNHHPDPSQLENMISLQETVLQTQADIGLALDGDGDRLGVVTNLGEVIWPDRQMMLYAIDVLKRQPGAQIVFDVKCSRHLKSVIEAHGGEAVMWKTGHSHIKRKLYQSGAALAGEMSGHIFFNDEWFGFDDALYTGVRLLKILAHSEYHLAALFAKLPDSINTPELRLEVEDDHKFLLMEQLSRELVFENAEIITIDGIRVEFNEGWGLIRASNTTPALIMRFEADSKAAMVRIQQAFRHQLLAINADWQLPF